MCLINKTRDIRTHEIRIRLLKYGGLKERERKMQKIKECFKNHRATLKDLGEVKILDWAEPGTCCRAIHYIIRSGNLIVTGDFYNAIYSWSEKVTFDFIANCDLWYFFSKFTMLSESKPHEWSGEEALKEFKEYLENYCDDMEKDKKAELLEYAENCAPNESEWTAFLNDNSELLNDDDYTLYSAGNMMPWMIEYHLKGLRLAMEQLGKKEEPCVPAGNTIQIMPADGPQSGVSNEERRG